MSETEDKGTKVLWATWRATYVQQNSREGCVFCEAVGAEMTPENLVLWRGEGAIVMMNRFPYAPGHLMVCPIRHVRDLEGLTSGESHELIDSTRNAIRVLSRYLTPDGFNVGLNLGKVAGAGYADHLHFHIVPRWNGDHNFMPVLADTRVMSEHLSQTYKKLREGFDLLKTELS